MSNRSYVYRVLEDVNGVPQRGVSVRVQNIDGTPFTAGLYTTNDGGSTLPNPFVSADGGVGFYIDTPARLLLVWRPNDATEDEVSVVDAQEYPAPEVVDVDTPSTGGSFDPSGSGTNSTRLSGTPSSDSAANAAGLGAVAIGDGANARNDRTTAVGTDSRAFADDATAVGDSSVADGHRSVAMGANAHAEEDDLGVLRVDHFEIVPSSPGGIETALILHDSAAARWKITVDTSGHLTTVAL